MCKINEIFFPKNVYPFNSPVTILHYGQNILNLILQSKQKSRLKIKWNLINTHTQISKLLCLTDGYSFILSIAKKSNGKSSLGIAVYVIQSSLLKIITIMPGFMAFYLLI